MKISEIFHNTTEKNKLAGIKESVNCVPHTKEDFRALTELFRRPLPTTIAIPSLKGLIEDDGLYDEISTLQQDQDARPVVAKWIELNMPDKLAKIKEEEMIGNGEGYFSVLHGFTATSNSNNRQ